MIMLSHGSTFPLPSLSSLSQLTSHQMFSSTFSLWRLKDMPTIRVLISNSDSQSPTKIKSNRNRSQIQIPAHPPTPFTGVALPFHFI
ncbi:hypothetical protein HanRHA438_Chr09g0383991 [Helianthus annuus]|uniref:Uncharacterized protein n=1 Tax=Helianthus annuus TaxID=4232 RepID=A0A251TLG1_HELAN|nr:hypothetical protein HanXRQr2_Chr10g0436211 [Helianthus annuus]KAJ0513536.1 hypothetical protein HanHA300_Chr10g0358711 [Helianthus annuus]KAJ0524884.1 hypothetical protein HanHA300_Chr09g0305651 [Helianthus annuus]KAJ0529637.1 hypothetical protein HanHA89_Chr10g0380171 [Helianthus annuus]KAJ0541248.1 hypothetical protein HanHA89_Chr09g0326261 [Helianthus annuus]